MLDRCLQNSITLFNGPVWVSEREGFSLLRAKIYIQEALLALHQRLQVCKLLQAGALYYFSYRLNHIAVKLILLQQLDFQLELW